MNLKLRTDNTETKNNTYSKTNMYSIIKTLAVRMKGSILEASNNSIWTSSQRRWVTSFHFKLSTSTLHNIKSRRLFFGHQLIQASLGVFFTFPRDMREKVKSRLLDWILLPKTMGLLLRNFRINVWECFRFLLRKDRWSCFLGQI